MAYVCHLAYVVCRTTHGKFHLHRVFQQRLGKLLYLLWHGGREHDGLAALRQVACYLHDVVAESHVEHPVGFVEYEKRHSAEVGVRHCDVAYQASGGGYHHVGTQLQALGLLVVASSVVAAIHCHAADAVEVVAESLHCLVYLLCQFAGGTHDDAVDGVFGVIAVVDEAEDGQQVGGGFACAGLGNANQVATIENLGDAGLLDGGAGLEAHVVERIEDVVV